MGDMTDNFSRSEFACACGCGFDDIKDYHVEMLQKVRTEIGIPMVINSGCRCMGHNMDVGGVPNSAHPRGEASDVACMDGTRRYTLISAALKVGFNRIGVAKTFVHLDRDPFLPAPRIWVY